MSLSIEQVMRVASLARIDLADDQTETTRVKLNSILELIEQLQAVDTSGIEPMSHPQDVAQRLRDDVASESDARDTYQTIAPRTENGLYLVPKVIE